MSVGVTNAGPCSVYYFSGVDTSTTTAKAVNNKLKDIGHDVYYNSKNFSGCQTLFAVSLTKHGQKLLEDEGFQYVSDYTSNTLFPNYGEGQTTSTGPLYKIADYKGILQDVSRCIAKFYFLNYREWLDKHNAKVKGK